MWLLRPGPLHQGLQGFRRHDSDRVRGTDAGNAEDPKKQRCRVLTINLRAGRLGFAWLTAVGASTSDGLRTGSPLIWFESGASARRGLITQSHRPRRCDMKRLSLLGVYVKNQDDAIEFYTK